MQNMAGILDRSLNVMRHHNDRQPLLIQRSDQLVELHRHSVGPAPSPAHQAPKLRGGAERPLPAARAAAGLLRDCGNTPFQIPDIHTPHVFLGKLLLRSLKRVCARTVKVCRDSTISHTDAGKSFCTKVCWGQVSHRMSLQPVLSYTIRPPISGVSPSSVFHQRALARAIFAYDTQVISFSTES